MAREIIADIEYDSDIGFELSEALNEDLSDSAFRVVLDPESGEYHLVEEVEG